MWSTSSAHYSRTPVPIVSLSRKGFHEDCGGFGVGEAEAGFCRGEGGGELRMILAEVLCGEEDVIEAGSVKPIADGGPEVARRQRVDETQLGEGARRFDERDELEVRLDVGVRFGVAGDGVLLPLRRRIGGRLEVEELPARLEIRKSLGVEDQSGGSVEGRGRVDDRTIDEFAVVRVHGC